VKIKGIEVIQEKGNITRKGQCCEIYYLNAFLRNSKKVLCGSKMRAVGNGECKVGKQR
jgi:hypothetical protein